MGIFSADGLAQMLLSIPAVLWAISFHEFCHGWAAYKLGDMTAYREGRLSVNPIAHVDPIGALMLVLFHFGWARPVPINSRYFRHPKRDIVIVSLAGAAGNFITALAVGLLFRFVGGSIGRGALYSVMVNMMYVNIGLGVFNLIPIPPLDGSRVLAVFLPPSMMRHYFFLERFGMFIILILVMTGLLQGIMRPLIRLAAGMIIRAASIGM